MGRANKIPLRGKKKLLKGILVDCLWCKVKVYVEPKKIGKKKYCSKHCLGKHKSRSGGIGSVKYKGGHITSHGYKLIYVNSKKIFEHRHVMEKKIGRKLLTSEHVHHKNHNKLDNRIDNLEILDIKEHGRIEGKRAIGIPKTHGKYTSKKL